VKFGMLHLFEAPMGRSDHQMITEQIELMEAAEELGFDSVWPAEHHFSEYGVCASPALSLAAIARRTSRIRLGTAVVVLPLNNPVRVAEDYAMLDNLSAGRVELEARRHIERYRAALAEAGHDPSTREVGALVMLYCADGQEQARREFADPVIWYFRTFGKYVAPKLGQPPVPGYEWYTAIRDLAGMVAWEDLLAHGAVICGEPDHVAERIAELRDVVGVDHLLCWTRLGGLEPGRVAHHMELIRDRVMPAVRATSGAAEA